MRHLKSSKNTAPTLGEHKSIMLNLMKALFIKGKVETTEDRGRKLKRESEKLITTAKTNTLHAKRQALKVLRDSETVKTLFEKVAPVFSEQSGGYTRMVKTGFRKGDNASMVIVSLLEKQ
jgi:large subunit ribosomal protein L17